MRLATLWPEIPTSLSAGTNALTATAAFAAIHPGSVRRALHALGPSQWRLEIGSALGPVMFSTEIASTLWAGAEAGSTGLLRSVIHLLSAGRMLHRRLEVLSVRRSEIPPALRATGVAWTSVRLLVPL